MNAYFFKMNQAEKNDILDKHKKIYDGYVTNYGQQNNQQPLYIQDFANDKNGLVVNNKGEVKTYTNIRINETKYNEMSDEFEEEDYSYVSPKKYFDGRDEIADTENHFEYGTFDDEEISCGCGSSREFYENYESYLDEEDTELYVDEDIVEPLQEQLNKTISMFKRFKKY